MMVKGKRRMESYCLMCIEFQFYRMKRLLEIDGGDGSTMLWMHLIPLNCTLKMAKRVNFMLCVFYHNKNNWKEWICTKDLIHFKDINLTEHWARFTISLLGNDKKKISLSSNILLSRWRVRIHMRISIVSMCVCVCVCTCLTLTKLHCGIVIYD